MAVRIDGAAVLVTGAAGGLGRAFTDALLERGAGTVYAGARDVAAVRQPGVVPIKLDITNEQQVGAAACRCRDIDLLINNAGIMRMAPVLAAPDLDAARNEMETNYFGTLGMCRAFAPVLAANGGGAIANILSTVSWFAMPFNGSYAASKAAEWSMTNATRIELRARGTLVTGVFAGVIDTEMAADMDVPKVSPCSVVAQTLDGLEAGAEEVLCDDRARFVKVARADDLSEIYPGIQSMWDSGNWRTPS